MTAYYKADHETARLIAAKAWKTYHALQQETNLAREAAMRADEIVRKTLNELANAEYRASERAKEEES
jgi:hypothetical protein